MSNPILLPDNITHLIVKICALILVTGIWWVVAAAIAV